MSDLTGRLVKIKPEWLNKDEPQIIFRVLEDRDSRLLIQELPEYKAPFRTFLHTEEVLKDWVIILDGGK